MSDGLGFGENTRAALDHPRPRRARPRRDGPRRPARSPSGGWPVSATSSRRARARAAATGASGSRSAGASRSTECSRECTWSPRACGRRGPLVALAAEVGIEMPIAEQVAAIVAGTTGPSTHWWRSWAARRGPSGTRTCCAASSATERTRRTAAPSRSRTAAARTSRRSARSGARAGRRAIPGRQRAPSSRPTRG